MAMLVILASAAKGQQGQGSGGSPKEGPAAKQKAERKKGAGGVDFLAEFAPGRVLPPVMIEWGDKDKNKALSRDEFIAMADDWFGKLDSDQAGKLSPDLFASKFGSLLPSSDQGFGPALFIAPGLFSAADRDKDGLLTRDELKETFGNWFDRWDKAKAGMLDADALGAGLAMAWPALRFGSLAGQADRLQAEVAKGADFSLRPPVKPLPPEEEAKHFLLPPGYRMELALADPEIQEPVAIAFDGNGRMYVAEMRTYMQNLDGEGQKNAHSRVSRHEDTDGDGVYDRHAVFIDNLVLPRLVLPWIGDSILSMETDADDVFKYTDTDGDGKADKKELFCKGVGRRGNLEHQQSGMVWGMDHWIYTTYNAFRLCWTPGGEVRREPTGANGGQWGLSMTDDGEMMWVEGGAEIGPVNFQAPIHYGAFSLPDEIEKDFRVPWGAPIGLADMQGGMTRVRMPDGSLNHFTAVSGEDVFRGHRLPADLIGDWMFGEPVARIVRRTKRIVTDGVAQLRNAYPKSEFIRSTDPLFRPVNMSTAPDGTMYVVDMYRGIIQEGTFIGEGSYLDAKVRQYGLDKVIRHGRIWRLRYEGIAPDRARPRMLDETPAELIRHLNHPNGWWRDTAQRLIVLGQDRSVVPALNEMARSSATRLARVHALWTLEGLCALDAGLVREALESDDPKMRIQGARLSESLYKAGDNSLVPDVQALANDADPNVVIQALLTLHYLKVPDATTLIRSTVERSKSRGVREIGGRLLQPAASKDEFAWFRYTPEQRKLLERGSSVYKELCTSCHGPTAAAPHSPAPRRGRRWHRPWRGRPACSGTATSRSTSS
jgi:glucose/arabinose dehydrogenase